MDSLNRDIKTILEYNREKAVAYAHKWAFNRNPAYLDFEKFGGDCTNFASQVLFAGSGIMNHKPTLGWYYVDSGRRTASWTGVGYLYDFLVNNKSAGPFAEEVDLKDIKPGDLIQLILEGRTAFHHTPVVVKTGYPADVGSILIAAHTYDRDNYNLSSYKFKQLRFLHITGVRRL